MNTFNLTPSLRGGTRTPEVQPRLYDKLPLSISLRRVHIFYQYGEVLTCLLIYGL